MSGEGAYTANLAALEAVVDQAGLFDARIEQRLGDIDDRIRALHASWTGEAAEAQGAVHARLMADAGQMREALRALRAVVAGAQTNYAAAVSANTRMWTIG